MKFYIDTIGFEYLGGWSPLWNIYFFPVIKSKFRAELESLSTNEILISKTNIRKLETKEAVLVKSTAADPYFSLYAVDWVDVKIRMEASLQDNDSLVVMITYGCSLYYVGLIRLDCMKCSGRMEFETIFAQDDRAHAKVWIGILFDCTLSLIISRCESKLFW